MEPKIQKDAWNHEIVVDKNIEDNNEDEEECTHNDTINEDNADPNHEYNEKGTIDAKDYNNENDLDAVKFCRSG